MLRDLPVNGFYPSYSTVIKRVRIRSVAFTSLTRSRGILMLEGKESIKMQLHEKQIQEAYARAREQYAKWGVDTEQVLERLKTIPVSIHCWQGDDVIGFERSTEGLTGGIQATGNYPGRANNPEELRADLDKALSLIPGRHRVNLHAIYAETGGARVNRDELGPEHCEGWVGWAKNEGSGLISTRLSSRIR